MLAGWLSRVGGLMTAPGCLVLKVLASVEIKLFPPFFPRCILKPLQMCRLQKRFSPLQL